MKITAFLGSPRAGGNTDILAAKVLEGAASAGVETEAIALRRLAIKPCVGCEKCWSKDLPCLQKDDMQSLYTKIAESDILLFATPVYWYAPTATMKPMIDRLVPLNRPQGRTLIKGKSVVLVTAYEEEGTEAVEPMLRMFELSFRYLELEQVGQVIADGVGPKGAVLEKPDMLAQAYALGRSLGKGDAASES